MRTTLATALVLACGPAMAGGFDCAKAATSVEKAVCAEPELSRAEDAMAQAYAKRFGQLGGAPRHDLATEQKAWLGKRETECPRDPKTLQGCVLDRTKDRTAALNAFGHGRVGIGDRYFTVGDGDDTAGPPRKHRLNLRVLKDGGRTLVSANLWLELRKVVRFGGYYIAEVDAKDCATSYCAKMGEADLPYVLAFREGGVGPVEVVPFVGGADLSFSGGTVRTEVAATPDNPGREQSWTLGRGMTLDKGTTWAPGSGTASDLWANASPDEATEAFGPGLADNRFFYETGTDRLGVPRDDLVHAFREDASHVEIPAKVTGGEPVRVVAGCARSPGSMNANLTGAIALIGPDGGFVVVLDDPEVPGPFQAEGPRGGTGATARFYPAIGSWKPAFAKAREAYLAKAAAGETGSDHCNP